MSIYDSTDEQKAEATKTKLQCYLNLAQCYLKVEAFPKAIENAKAALEIEPENTKGNSLPSSIASPHSPSFHS